MSESLNIYIVEDKSFTRIALEDKLIEQGHVITGSSVTAEQAWDFLKNDNKTELLLLDLNLAGEKDGIWLAKKVRESLNMAIIYLTAYGDDNTLHDIAETNPNGYLMKPYNTPSLIAGIQIAMVSFRAGVKDSEESIGDKDSIYIKDGRSRIKMRLVDVLFIQSEGNYLNIHCVHRKYVTRMKIGDFIKTYNYQDFVRVHRRYVVNIKYIDRIENEHLMVAGENIPVSHQHRADLNNALNV